MPLIWGQDQCGQAAARWRDGQIAHGPYSRLAGKKSKRPSNLFLIVSLLAFCFL
jgi:hypothetical protein